MAEALSVFDIFPVSPKRLYEAWLSSIEHSAFTNSVAKIDPRIDGKFSAWDGYITGKTVTLEPYSRIVQIWRTTDFAEDDPDSILEVLIQPAEVGCQVILNHTGLPDGRGDEFEQGWEDYYFAPMQGYFQLETE